MTVTERLLHYVSFDTQSDESSETCPSTAKQKLLGEALVEEMRAMGIADARIDADGYVYGSVPGTPGAPAIGLIAHMLLCLVEHSFLAWRGGYSYQRTDLDGKL